MIRVDRYGAEIIGQAIATDLDDIEDLRCEGSLKGYAGYEWPMIALSMNGSGVSW